MSASPHNRGETTLKMLPDANGGEAAPVSPSPAISNAGPTRAAAAAPAVRQMADMPRDELDHLAEEYGLDPTRYKTRQQLVTALHDRRQLIAALDREALLDVIRWGRRPVTVNATNEQL